MPIRSSYDCKQAEQTLFKVAYKILLNSLCVITNDVLGSTYLARDWEPKQKQVWIRHKFVGLQLKPT